MQVTGSNVGKGLERLILGGYYGSSVSEADWKLDNAVAFDAATRHFKCPSDSSNFICTKGATHNKSFSYQFFRLRNAGGGAFADAKKMFGAESTEVSKIRRGILGRDNPGAMIGGDFEKQCRVPWGYTNRESNHPKFMNNVYLDGHVKGVSVTRTPANAREVQALLDDFQL